MRIVLIEEQPLFREGFRRQLNEFPGFVVVGTAAHAREGLKLVDELAPEVVVVDLVLPGMSGTTAIREIRGRKPAPRVLAICGTCHERDVLDAFAAGATGFVAKTDSAEVFADAIRAVANDERFLGPSARTLALGPPGRGNGRAWRRDDVLAVLSARERDVFDLIVRGFKNRDVARELCISVKTVETHRLHINRKLLCSSSMDLVQFALGNGILEWRDGMSRAGASENAAQLMAQ
jgi:two-component system, LuxR family, secretion system response regulator SsrB